jgi:hypothetical protein
MKGPSIRSALVIAILLFGAGFVLRAQQAAKSEVVVEMEVARNGSVVGKPAVRMVDGGTATLHLSDGTDIKLTSRVITR